MSVEYPKTRADLLARVDAAWSELDAYVAGLSDDQLVAPGPDGGWSVADHLHHLGAWKRKVLAQLRGESIPAALGIDQATWDGDDIDAINGAIMARGRAVPLPGRLASFRQAHADLRAAIERYPEADYGRPAYPDLAESGPMVADIAGNTYEHDPEHLGYIRTLTGG